MFGPSVAGMHIEYARELESPRVKRWQFSGGVNETRKEWNRAEWNRCAKVILIKASNTLLVPEFMRAEFEAELVKIPEGK